MNIYTKNQGAGDFSVNYRSKFNYTVSGSPYIAMGQSYMIYNGQLNRVKLNDTEVPRVLYALNAGNSEGPQANTEIISHIELLFTSAGGDTFLCNILEGGIYSKNGHLVNYYFDNDLRAKNEFINISVNGVLGSLTFEGADLQTISKISNGTNTADVLSALSNVSSANGLVCNSILKGWNTTSGDINPLTVNLNGDKNQLEVRDNDAVAELTSIDNKTVQQYNTTNNSISGYNSNNVALSTYVIPSKTKSFKFSAFTTNTGTNAFIGSSNSSTTFSNANFGLANSRQFYVIRSGTTSASLSLAITYIDASGNEQDAVIAAPLPTTLTAISGVTGITINSVRANQTYTTNDTVSIAYANNINTSFAGGNFYQNNNALFTCPNNAIAWVQNVSFFSQGSADNLRLFKWTTQGVRETIFAWTTQTNFNSNASGEYGFGGYITAGETLGWGGENSSTQKVVYANVVVKYFN
jgi:hypothetical protein